MVGNVLFSKVSAKTNRSTKTCAAHNYTQPWVPMPIPSKFFPLRKRLSCRTGTASRLMSFSEGGGDPSTQPFQPFLAAARFLRGGGAEIAVRCAWASNDSSSSGVRGLLDEVCDVLEEMEGPGVEPGVDAWRRRGEVGDGVTDTERCTVGIRMVGRARQKDDALLFATGGILGNALVLAKLPSFVACWPASAICCSFRARAAAFSLLLSSRLCSFFSCFLFSLASSSRSTSLYGPTPFSKLVRTSLGGRGSKAPAITAVAFRRICLWYFGGILWWERRTAME
jgi:hypothetical protein